MQLYSVFFKSASDEISNVFVTFANQNSHRKILCSGQKNPDCRGEGGLYVSAAKAAVFSFYLFDKVGRFYY